MIINVAVWQEKIRAILGIQGGNPIPDTDHLLPGVTVESDRPEWCFPGGELLCGWGELVLAGGAGTFGAVSFTNPSDSGMLVTVTDAFLGPAGKILIGGAGVVNIGLGAAVSIAGGRDLRISKSQTVAVQVREGTPAATTGTPLVQTNVSQVQSQSPGVVAILPPGFAILLFCGTANVNFEASLFWRERPLHKGIRA